MSNEPRRPGRHFLQIPGPTPVPDRVQRAMAMPILDPASNPSELSKWTPRAPKWNSA